MAIDIIFSEVFADNSYVYILKLIFIIILGSIPYHSSSKTLNFCSISSFSLILTVTCKYFHNLALSDNDNQEIIGYSAIIQDEINYETLITGLLVGPVSAVKFTLPQPGKYRVTVFPIIGLSFDHSYIKYTNTSYSEIFNVFELINTDNVTKGNNTINNGKILCNLQDIMCS